jgi:hypothetical protein
MAVLKMLVLSQNGSKGFREIGLIINYFLPKILLLSLRIYSLLLSARSDS